jgi:hypothetical protein
MRYVKGLREEIEAGNSPGARKGPFADVDGPAHPVAIAAAG